jgi:hypothetical protein
VSSNDFAIRGDVQRSQFFMFLTVCLAHLNLNTSAFLARRPVYLPSVTSRAAADPEYCCWPVSGRPSRTANGRKRLFTMKFVAGILRASFFDPKRLDALAQVSGPFVDSSPLVSAWFSRYAVPVRA